MARRRHYAPEQDLVHVSFKCVGDAFLMRPDAYTSFVIASALAGAAEKYGVRIHAFGILSSHGHLELGIRGCRLDSFMQHFKSRTAMELNAHRGRDGAFFKQRYRCEPILSEEAAVGIELYVHAQAVSHELVERAIEWPGLSSYAAVSEGRASVEVSWFDDEAWREAGAKRSERQSFVHVASVPLTPLPHRAGMSESALSAERRALVARMKEVELEVSRKRRSEGARRLPRASRYTSEDPNGMPSRDREKTPQPYAHGSEAEVRAYREAYAEVMVAYERASARYRESGRLCPFPAGTYPPRIAIARDVL
ncbi:MAG: transposase [Sandaracinaceae bacterium]|nr:transposase [Sandaracinaceae bacterium]